MKHFTALLALTLYTATSIATPIWSMVSEDDETTGFVVYEIDLNAYMHGLLDQYHYYEDNQNEEHKTEPEALLSALEKADPFPLRLENPYKLSLLHYMLLKEMYVSFRPLQAIHILSARVNNFEENLPQVIEVLARKGEEGVDVRDIDGNTPLHYAVRYGHSDEVIRALVVNGADIYAENNKGETPVDLANIYLKR